MRILLLVLAIVGAAAWLWLGAAPTTPRAYDGAGGANDSPGPTLAARPASVPAPPTREVGTDAPPTDRASAVGSATIVGRVHAATRIRAGVEAVVFVTTGNGGSDVLAQAIVGSDGAYRMSMEVPSSDGIDVELGARVPGALAGFARLHVRAGDVVRHDLELARGSTIAGRVLDSHGNAMAGLEVMANSPRVLGMTSRVGRLFRTVRPGRLLSSSTASYHEGRAFTGPDGRFEMTGLAEGEYTFWTPSSEWMVRQTERVPAPSVGVTLVVDPLAGFSIRVLDDASGNELRSFDGMAEIAAGVQRTAMPVRSEEGADEFLWRELDAERTQGCEVTLRMGSPGYEPRVEVFRIEPGPRPTPITVRLKQPMFVRVAVRATEAGGRAHVGPLRGTVRSREGASSERVPVTFLPREPGAPTLVAMIPKGSWTLAVAPAVELGELCTVHADVDADAGEASVSLEFPAWGSVELVRPPDPEPVGRGATVVLRSADGAPRVASLLMESATVLLPALPLGRWTASIRASWCDPSPVEFEVRLDETRQVVFRAR